MGEVPACAATLALARMGVAAHLVALQCESKSPDFRCAGCQGLGMMGEEGAKRISLVLPCLNDPEAKVRACALAGLDALNKSVPLNEVVLRKMDAWRPPKGQGASDVMAIPWLGA